ncbi:hypothetical protein BOH74_05960 [Pseudomonas versuta]|uniref:Uncharacterized protein n=1 Tax=Pseudomonas versuta TaxID=1788301 RepID=A0A853ZZR7_9PSED|nr:hypothetical protein BOH74_05960 [Pseudomonas versuta]
MVAQPKEAVGPSYNIESMRLAQAMGWVLNLNIKDHRVSDFPHAVHRGGDLGDFEHYPNQGLWILEIQIAHPDLPSGAFFEDLLA